jgi:hypothetical protein
VHLAIVRKLDKGSAKALVKHSETEATYSLVTDRDGQKYLQIDTYGSAERKIPGKTSQSIRLSKEALLHLVRVVETEFGD